MKGSRAPFAGVCSVLSLLPIAFTIWFVEGFSLKVPIADHWALVTLYGQIVTGQAHLADFLRPHNGLHVILVGRLVLFLLAYLTDLSFRAEIYLGLSLVLVTAWMLRATGRSSFPPETGRAAVEVVSLFTVLLLFAPQQWILWTWSIGFFHFLENASVVGAVWALALAQPRIGLAILFCAIATFNRFEGLLSWIVLFPAVIHATRRLKKPRMAPALFALSGVICWCVCLASIFHFTPEGLHHAQNSLSMLKARLLFVANLVGSAPASFSGRWDPTGTAAFAFIPAGVIICVLFVGLSVLLGTSREWRARALPWISLGAFGLAFAGAAAVGRADVLQPGPVSPLQRFIVAWYVSAYSVTASFVAIATVHLLAVAFSRKWKVRIPRAALGGALTALGLALFAANYAYALPELLAKRSEGRADLYCVELAAYMEEPNTCALRSEDEKLLERARLRWIRHDVTFEDAAPKAGFISRVSEERALDGSEIQRVVVSGWAALPDEKAGTVLLEFGERRRFFAHASRLQLERGGVLWSVSIPRDAFDAPRDVVHAWTYDKARGQFLPLSGEARLLTR